MQALKNIWETSLISLQSGKIISIGDNALIFDAYFWCDVRGEKNLRRVRSDIRMAISQAFTDAGIVIAFPQRDLHLHTAKPIAIKVET